MFHVSQLKKAVANHRMESELPLELEIDVVALLKLEAILFSWENTKHGGKAIDLLICWKHKLVEKAIWEKVAYIRI